MMNKLVVLAVLVLAATSCAFADFVLIPPGNYNGSFETGSPAGWTVTSGNWITESTDYGLARDNSVFTPAGYHFVDLQDGGNVQRSITVHAGWEYQLRFSMIGWSSAQYMQVSVWDGSTSGDLLYQGNWQAETYSTSKKRLDWQDKSISTILMPTSGNLIVRFTALNDTLPANNLQAVDFVRLYEQQPVPEPGTTALFATLLLGLPVAYRMRKKGAKKA